MSKRITLVGIGALALVLMSAGPALGADPAGGTLLGFNAADCGLEDQPGDDTECLASFEFQPYGEHVRVTDRNPNGWGVLVELWWGGEIQRWCWNTKGFGGGVQDCNFKIPDGRSIDFYLAEFHKDEWQDGCLPGDGCGKRTHFWAGPDDDGCFANDGPPCAAGDGDFRGEA